MGKSRADPSAQVHLSIRCSVPPLSGPGRPASRAEPAQNRSEGRTAGRTAAGHRGEGEAEQEHRHFAGSEDEVSEFLLHGNHSDHQTPV